MVVCATNGTRDLHDSLKVPGLERVQLPIIVNGEDVSADASLHADKDVGPESFSFDGQTPLCRALSRIDQVLHKDGKVFVCCPLIPLRSILRAVRAGGKSSLRCSVKAIHRFYA